LNVRKIAVYNGFSCLLIACCLKFSALLNDLSDIQLSDVWFYYTLSGVICGCVLLQHATMLAMLLVQLLLHVAVDKVPGSNI